MTLLMADWSDPGTTVITGVDAIAFYIGGWTPHVWTTAQIKAQTVALMMPIWVYNPSRPGSSNGTTDGNAAVAALRTLSVPPGVRVGVDMETKVDAAYVLAFRNVIASAGYWTTIYGSASSVFGNCSLAAGFGGGWWVADWTGSPHEYPHVGVWATQYANPTLDNLPWDMDEVSVLDHLWAHVPASFTLTATVSDATSSSTKTARFVVG